MTNKNVKIEHVSVKKLFGIYSYDFSIDDQVSIIIAPNGLGKSTIFRLIKATMGADEEELNRLRKIPFDEFMIKLSDDSIITLSRCSKNDYISMLSEKDIKPWTLEVLDKMVELGVNYKFSIFTAYDIATGNSIENTKEYNIYYFSSVLERMRRGSKDSIIEGCREAMARQRKLLEDTKCFYQTNLIPTDRLFVERKDPDIRDRRRDSAEKKYKSTLDEALAKMLEKVNITVKAYGQAISKAQSELPVKYLHPEQKAYPEFPTFKEKWNAYISELNKFYILGLINKEATDIIEITEEDYKTRKEFLNTYLELFSDAIKPLYLYYDKFSIFKTIFDERNELTEKKIKFTPDGIKILITNSMDLDKELLSSGEKNDFIMFYNLLFNTKKGSIVMIDEPEISLHIAWQDTFVHHIISIAETNDLQVFIATHSPHIVSGHFDLVKDL